MTSKYRLVKVKSGHYRIQEKLRHKWKFLGSYRIGSDCYTDLVEAKDYLEILREEEQEEIDNAIENQKKAQIVKIIDGDKDD